MAANSSFADPTRGRGWWGGGGGRVERGSWGGRRMRFNLLSGTKSCKIWGEKSLNLRKQTLLCYYGNYVILDFRTINEI